ncbi:MAG: hypothetical protein AAF604_09740 [Acidobacteriota bacterium]
MSQSRESTLPAEISETAQIVYLGGAESGREAELVRLLGEKPGVQVDCLDKAESLLDHAASERRPSLAVVDCSGAGLEALELLAVANQVRHELPIVALCNPEIELPPWASKARVVLPIARPRDDRWLAGMLTEMCHEVGLCPDRWQAQVLVDYLALAYFTRVSAQLELRVEGLARRLYLALSEGKIFSAVLHELEGRDAVAAVADRVVTEVLVRGRGVSSSPPEDLATSPVTPEAHRPTESVKPPEPRGDYDRAMRLGLAAAMRADYQDAEACFRKALAERPGDRRARFNLDRVLSR